MPAPLMPPDPAPQGTLERRRVRHPQAPAHPAQLGWRPGSRAGDSQILGELQVQDLKAVRVPERLQGARTGAGEQGEAQEHP